ncbi:HAMP domain-containing protein [Marinomonas sp. A79]|uniref:histidine kinase n=1 Tax=Marinomonas vulgaris TaxID=2823372 RepID=A0ABS5HAM5_9GAMM|nr:HAMP domain-containing sensor histidine kinase [Marinomonas vulgaris]MBR7888074.1 HAMP domain-containing protein [Marinomonas vulgaris]
MFKRQNKRLSNRYLLLSLVVALVPLLVFSGLYDTYLNQLVVKISNEQLSTRVATVQNEFQTSLRERLYQLDVLTDELDNPNIYTLDGAQSLSSELQTLLRIQTDLNNVYGIAFFDEHKHYLWSFPEFSYSKKRYEQSLIFPVTPFEGTEIYGPEAYSFNHASSVLLLKKIHISSLDIKGAPYIGIVLRFNSLTSISKDLNTDGIYTPLLSVPGERLFDIVGQPVDKKIISHADYDLLPNWSLKLRQDKGLSSPPSAKMRYWLILLVLMTATGLLALHWYISKRLNRQLDTLIDRVERVAAGDLDSPVPLQPGTELERLTLAIDRMRSQLHHVIKASVEMERQASLGQLAAGLAHDIRNPLTIIRMTIQTLIKRESNSQHNEMLVMVEEEIERVNRVIENLLNFARPTQPRLERITLLELLKGIRALVDASAKSQNVIVHLECNSALEIDADPSHIRQIFMNLILNAIQAMPIEGGKISLIGSIHGGHIIVSVIDNGKGIPVTLISRISEPFFTTKSTGTGLGLAICHVLAKSNHAELVIESQENKGTHVQLRFKNDRIEENKYE